MDCTIENTSLHTFVSIIEMMSNSVGDLYKLNIDRYRLYSLSDIIKITRLFADRSIYERKYNKSFESSGYGENTLGVLNKIFDNEKEVMKEHYKPIIDFLEDDLIYYMTINELLECLDEFNDVYTRRMIKSFVDGKIDSIIGDLYYRSEGVYDGNLYTGCIEDTGDLVIIKGVCYGYTTRGNTRSGVLVIPEGVVEIANSAFSTKGIRELVLPTTLRKIWNYAFYNNEIYKIEFKEGLEYIGCNAFSGHSISELQLPESIKYVGDSSFYGEELSRLTIPQNIKHIGETAFRLWGTLFKGGIVLPNTIEYVGRKPFLVDRKCYPYTFEGTLGIDCNAIVMDKVIEFINDMGGSFGECKITPSTIKETKQLLEDLVAHTFRFDDGSTINPKDARRYNKKEFIIKNDGYVTVNVEDDNDEHFVESVLQNTSKSDFDTLDVFQ